MKYWDSLWIFIIYSFYSGIWPLHSFKRGHLHTHYTLFASVRLKRPKQMPCSWSRKITSILITKADHQKRFLLVEACKAINVPLLYCYCWTQLGRKMSWSKWVTLLPHQCETLVITQNNSLWWLVLVLSSKMTFYVKTKLII